MIQSIKIPNFSQGQDKIYINNPKYFYSLLTSDAPLFTTEISLHEFVKKEGITYYKLKVKSTNTGSSYDLIFNVPEQFHDTVRYVHNTYIDYDESDTEAEEENDETKEVISRKKPKKEIPEMIFIWKCESEDALDWKKSISDIVSLFTSQLQTNCTFNGETPEVNSLMQSESTLLNYHHKKITAQDFYTTFNPTTDTFQLILAGGYWAHGRNEIGASWQIPCFKGKTRLQLHNDKLDLQNKRKKRIHSEIESTENQEIVVSSEDTTTK